MGLPTEYHRYVQPVQTFYNEAKPMSRAQVDLQVDLCRLLIPRPAYGHLHVSIKADGRFRLEDPTQLLQVFVIDSRLDVTFLFPVLSTPTLPSWLVASPSYGYTL